MPICSIRTGRSQCLPLCGAARALVVATLLLGGCSAQEKFRKVSPQLESPSTPVAPTTTATTLPALVPYAGDGFTISLPGQPTVEKQTASSPAGPVEVTVLTVLGEDHGYSVSYNAVPATGFDLDGAARGAATGVKGTLTDVSPVTYKGYAGRDFRVAKAQDGQVTVFSRVLRVKKRVYQVQALFLGDVTAPPDDVYRQVLESLAV